MLTWVLGFAVGSILLAAILHFALPAGGGKVPAVVVGTLGGFVAGAVLGMLGAVYYGEAMQNSVYGNQYRPDPLPSGGAMKGVNAPPSSQGEPPAEKKKSAPRAGGGGPGRTNLANDYPGVNDAKKKEPAEAPPAK